MTKGSCSCGAINFSYTGDPAAIAACHCLACRKSSGNTHSINVIVPQDKLNITSGKDTLKDWKRSGDSGKEVTNSFCSTCGNLLFVKPAAMEGVVIVKYGMIDEADVLDKMAPQQEIYCKNLLGWEKGYSMTEKKDEA